MKRDLTLSSAVARDLDDICLNCGRNNEKYFFL